MSVRDDPPPLRFDDADDNPDALAVLIDPLGNNLANFRIWWNGRRRSLADSKLSTNKHRDEQAEGSRVGSKHRHALRQFEVPLQAERQLFWPGHGGTNQTVPR